MSTDLMSLHVDAQQIAKVEEVAAECGRQLAARDKPFAASFALAAGIKKLGELITNEMMSDVMALQGTPLGFKTDKDRDKHGNPGPGYEIVIVKPAFIEASARGFRPTNNEFNIIAGRFYGAKNGFLRLVKTFPGLTDFVESVSVPERAGGRAMVSYVAKWNLDGKPMSYQRSQKKLQDGTPFDNRIVVRVNEGSTDDAILGKVYRKAYAGIYDLLTGSTMPTPEGEVDDVTDVQSRPVATAKVQSSTLFDETPPEEADPEDQLAILQEYRDKLGEATKKSHISPLAKQAGGDTRLTDASRKSVMGWCSERQKEL